MLGTLPRFAMRVSTYVTVWATDRYTGKRTHMGSVPVKYKTDDPNSIYKAEAKACGSEVLPFEEWAGVTDLKQKKQELWLARERDDTLDLY